MLDFGGGIGLGYARVMRSIPELIAWWRIVELPDVVSYGTERLADQRLSFHHSIGEAINGDTPTLVTCNGALQCMEAPYDCLAELFSLRAPAIVIRSTPLEDRERFSVFHTVSGDKIPWRVLDRQRLEKSASGYCLAYEQVSHRPNGDASADERDLLYFSSDHKPPSLER